MESATEAISKTLHSEFAVFSATVTQEMVLDPAQRLLQFLWGGYPWEDEMGTRWLNKEGHNSHDATKMPICMFEIFSPDQKYYELAFLVHSRTAPDGYHCSPGREC